MKHNIIQCDKCNNLGYSYYIDEQGEVRGRWCTCHSQRLLLQKLENVGLGKYFNKTLADFTTNYGWQEYMFNTATDYINEGYKEGNWLMICGQYGSGKSLLSSIVLKEILSAEEKYVPIAIVWSSFVEQYKLAWGTENREKLQEIINIVDEMKTADILYLDEILKVDTQSTQNVLFDIINFRYLNDKPTILTCEKLYDDLKVRFPALCGRVFEKTSHKYLLQIGYDDEKNMREKIHDTDF